MPTSPEVANPYLSPEYDTSPEVLHTPGPRQEDGQGEPDQSSGFKISKGEIRGMKRKTFVIALGIFAVLIIAVAAGVGWGVGVAAVRSRNNNNGASESTRSKSQDSSVSTDSSYVSWNFKTCGSLVKRTNLEIKQLFADTQP